MTRRQIGHWNLYPFPSRLDHRESPMANVAYSNPIVESLEYSLRFWAELKEYWSLRHTEPPFRDDVIGIQVKNASRD